MEENKKQEKSFSFSLTEKIINSAFAIIALVFFALLKILACFGVFSTALSGIFAIIIIGLSVTGVLWNYLRSKHLSTEFFFSAGVCFVVLISMI